MKYLIIERDGERKPILSDGTIDLNIFFISEKIISSGDISFGVSFSGSMFCRCFASDGSKTQSDADDMVINFMMERNEI